MGEEVVNGVAEYARRHEAAATAAAADDGEPSDEALVWACRRGEVGAWEALVRRHQRLVVGIARRAGLDEDLAREVAQQVFTTLVGYLDRIDEPSRVGAWLTTTARRESWRVARRERSVGGPVAVPDDGSPDEPIDDNPRPEEVLLRLEERRRVRRALMVLDAPCARLLTLLFYRGEPLPYAAIAAMLGVPTGSIGPTRARCLQKLRRLLESPVETVAH
jgi:RNA polymerase sigma factor (sigma-70 family)